MIVSDVEEDAPCEKNNIDSDVISAVKCSLKQLLKNDFLLVWKSWFNNGSIAYHLREGILKNNGLVFAVSIVLDFIYDFTLSFYGAPIVLLGKFYSRILICNKIVLLKYMFTLFKWHSYTKRHFYEKPSKNNLNSWKKNNFNTGVTINDFERKTKPQKGIRSFSSVIYNHLNNEYFEDNDFPG